MYWLDFLEVDKYWSEGIKGDGVKIAVFDKGVQKHVDLNVAGGINAYDEAKSPFLAYNGHGLRVSGIIAGKQTGVAPNASIYSVKLDDNAGGGNDKDAILRGLDWAIDNDIDIINCSFSYDVDELRLYNKFKQAFDAGIIIVCSSGNRQNNVTDMQDVIRAPAKYPFSVTCASVNSRKNRAGSSCVGKQVKLSSGGSSVRSTTVDTTKEVSDKYATGLSGTSYASAGISGVFALYKQMYPQDSNKKLIERVLHNAETIGDSWVFGAGLPKYPKSYNNIQIKGR